jgi:hypothetical protein
MGGISLNAGPSHQPSVLCTFGPVRPLRNELHRWPEAASASRLEVAPSETYLEIRGRVWPDAHGDSARTTCGVSQRGIKSLQGNFLNGWVQLQRRLHGVDVKGNNRETDPSHSQAMPGTTPRGRPSCRSQ